MPTNCFRGLIRFSMVIGVACLISPLAQAQQPDAKISPTLFKAQEKRLDLAVKKGLAWLSKVQRPDGSFPGPAAGQPGISSLSGLAFMSAGHLPGSKPYGEQIERVVKYALSCERRPGFFNASRPGGIWQLDAPSHTGFYNQAIAGLMLAEVSGELTGKLSDEVVSAIKRSVEFTERKQLGTVLGRPEDEGGWRYPVPNPIDRFQSDLSITAWQATFLRSAENAGYEVNPEVITKAQRYVQGMYKANKRTFTYDHRRTTRAMAGAGIMAMAMLGQHDSKEAKSAAAWIKAHPFTRYGELVGSLDRFQYSVYYCTQGMYQLGGKHYREFFPQIVDLLVENQEPDGSWRAVGFEKPFGKSYATAMAILALTTYNELLPIHQR